MAWIVRKIEFFNLAVVVKGIPGHCTADIMPIVRTTEQKRISSRVRRSFLT